MIIEEYTTFNISGENLDIDSLCLNIKLPITILGRKGEISDKGRYKNKPLPFSLIAVGDNHNLYSLDAMLNMVYPYKEYWKKYGIDSIDFCLYIAYKEQCNFCLTKDQINKISQLDIDLMINCFDKKESVSWAV